MRYIQDLGLGLIVYSFGINVCIHNKEKKSVHKQKVTSQKLKLRQMGKSKTPKLLRYL